MSVVEQPGYREHSVAVAAPADTVYGLVANAARWPLLLPHVVHVEPLPGACGERLLLWAADGCDVASWMSRRTYEPRRRRVVFRCTGPSSQGAFGGSWTVVERAGDGGCVLTLRHEGPCRPGPPHFVRWLAEFGRLAEDRHAGNDLTFGFAQELRVRGPAELALAFLYGTAELPATAPPPVATDVTEPVPGVRVETVRPDAPGAAPSTRSVRLCFPHAGRFVHKQTAAPLVAGTVEVAGHTGEWALLPDERGATLRARHRVLLRGTAVRQHPEPAVRQGPGPDLVRVRNLLRAGLARRSRALLEEAGVHAESAVTLL
ncbi:SRPBCC family protein [Streptomyces sp. NPDC047315]|uniref:SRPBCC family protein n=1 Tax=Streptomyces sp. NPDC047315 TaxID=3155142 RepID=UPI003404AF20